MNRSLSTDTVRGFCTLIEREGCMMTEVDLEHVFSWHVGRQKPSQKGQFMFGSINPWRCIIFQTRRFFFDPFKLGFKASTGHGFTCPKSTVIIVKPSPLNKVQKPLTVSVERVYICVCVCVGVCVCVRRGAFPRSCWFPTVEVDALVQILTTLGHAEGALHQL